MTENEARQMEVEIKWNGRANVCVHCGKVPETYYITTGHDHTDDSIRYCFCRPVAPSIEQLRAQLAKAEQRVAEACAELADKMNPFPEPSAIGPEIRSGEWRKFVKEV